MNENLHTGSSTGVAVCKAGALAAAAAMAGGMQTYADPVRFENVGGEFFWKDRQLDITRPYDRQPSNMTLSSTLQKVEYRQHPYGGDPLIDARTHGALVIASVFEYVWQSPYWLVDPVLKGETISNAMEFRDKSAIASWIFIPNTRYYAFVHVPTTGVFYLPARFKVGNDEHFGWIAGEWGVHDGVRPLAWGYETTPNTPIAAGAVPPPGTLAALAFGAAATMGRRPRRESRPANADAAHQIARRRG